MVINNFSFDPELLNKLKELIKFEIELLHDMIVRIKDIEKGITDDNKVFLFDLHTLMLIHAEIDMNISKIFEIIMLTYAHKVRENLPKRYGINIDITMNGRDNYEFA